MLAAARAAHWGIRHAWRDPLLWILHVGYAWVPIGLALLVVGWPMASAFVLVTAAAMIRVLAPLFEIRATRGSLFVAGGMWALAFALFVIVYTPVLAGGMGAVYVRAICGSTRRSR